jgi:hypothetical protein
MKYVTGLDWSGNPGDPALTPNCSPLLVYAAVHAPTSEISSVQAALREARQLLRLREDYPFKHSGSAQKTRQIFFGALNKTPIFASALIIDKREWDLDGDNRGTGEQRICDGIIDLVCGLSNEMVSGQLLLIDKPRSELRIVKEYRTAIRKALKGANRGSFEDVRPRPDDRDDSATVQIADMIAGELADHAGIGGPHFSSIERRITILGK